MNYADLQTFFHHHCKIKLRSGKEIFGVLWKDLSETDRAIYFASYIDHKKMLSTKPALSVRQENFMKIQIDDILGVEPLN